MFRKDRSLKFFIFKQTGTDKHLSVIVCIICFLISLIPVANAAENVFHSVAASSVGIPAPYLMQEDSNPQSLPMQVITPDPLAIEVGPGAAMSFGLIYDTLPQDDTLTGIGVRVHYDSSKLTFDQVSETLTFGRLFNPDLVQSEPDVSDFDGDPDTDSFISLAWVDFGGNWPGAVPEKLAQVHFVTARDFAGSTAINFSASDLAAGYEFSSIPAIAGQNIIFADGFE